MSTYALMGDKSSRSLPLGLQYLEKIFPGTPFSREFFNTLEEIESIRQAMFEISDKTKKREQFLGSFSESLQSLKQWVTFIPPKKKNIFGRLFSSSCPSEATLLLMYAAAAVMGAWMSLTSQTGSEAWSRSTFKEMLDAQVSGKGSDTWKKDLKNKAQQDKFWEDKSDIFAVVDRLLT